MTQTLVPFGVRHAVTVEPEQVATLIYDADRQINFVADDGVLIEAGKHSTGQTGTGTAKSDSTPADTDKDQTED